jgi:predicted transcriptional regulator YdeE
MSETMRRVEGFCVAGLEARTRNADEGPHGKIGSLWQRVQCGECEQVMSEDPAVYSVYSGYESDEKGFYDVLVGKALKQGARAPEGMQEIAVAGGEYQVFPVRDARPESVVAAWGEVYRYFASEVGRRRAFATDFEKHAPGGSEIWVGVK